MAGPAMMAGGLGLGIYGSMSAEDTPETSEGVTLTGEVSPADRANAALMASKAETAAKQREANNPTALKGSMPSGGMTSKEYDAYLNQALNNRNSSINQGLQGMMRERQRQMDNQYNQVRDAEMARQNALPNPSVYNSDGTVSEGKFNANMGDRVRNTANDNALAWHARQNGIDNFNNKQAGNSNGGYLLNRNMDMGVFRQGQGNASPINVAAQNAGVSGPASGISGPASGNSGPIGEQGEDGSVMGDVGNALMTAGTMSDEALKVAQLAKSQGGVGNALKAIGSGKGNLAGLNAAGGGALLNKGLMYGSAAQGLHGAAEEMFGYGMLGEDATEEGRRANAYGNMQNRLMNKMGLSDQWKQRLSSIANPINRVQGAMDAFVNPFTGGGLDVVRGSMASMFGDDKFAKESGYDMDPFGTGRLMDRAMKTTPSWQRTKYNGQQP
jgi:hypothetical protein